MPKPFRVNISLDEVLSSVSYDKETGIFTSKIRRGNRKAGSVIGGYNGFGYIQFQINKVGLMAHRVAFFIEHGYMPEFIDHINGIRDDNRICNLREVDKYQNAYNSFRKSNSGSRFKGVSWHKPSKRWQVQIREQGKMIALGYFDNDIEAAFAYDVASLRIHGEFGKRNILPLVF